MSVPCHNDPDPFISDSLADQREAARLCHTCPAFDACHELRLGEDAGVYAATLPSDPERRLFRRENRRSLAVGFTCRNGHDLGTTENPTENRVPLTGVFYGDSNLPRVGCRRCTDLRDLIDLEARVGRPDYADVVGA